MGAVLSRRAALIGCGACLAAVAGCTSYGPEAAPDQGADGGQSSPPAASFEASAADIPVGGGKVYADRQIVITQPTAGQFKAFSAVCTHQGCVVASVAETITCDCHGSQYSITDGSVVSPPAQQPLRAYQVSVSGETITVQT